LKLNNDIRCLIETLFNRVAEYNALNLGGRESALELNKNGIILHVNSNYWRGSGYTANSQADLEDMVKWLDETLAIELKDLNTAIRENEEEPQRELEKGQI
jgi:hypothetical protein